METKFVGSDRKRDAPGTSLAPIVPPKKAKVTGAAPVLGRAGATSGAAEAWEMLAIDCEPPDLIPSVLEACQLDEADKVVRIFFL